MSVGTQTLVDLHNAFRAHDRKTAWKLYQRLETTGELQPDDYSTILGYTATHTLPQRGVRYAERVMDSMRRQGFKPDLRDWHAILTCHLRVKDIRRLATRFEHMVEDGTDPDVKAYTILLAAYARLKNKNLLWSAWERMVQSLPGSEVDMDARAVMVDALGRAGDLSGAEMLVEDIERALRKKNGWRKGVGKSIFANIKLYEALIRAYGVNGQLHAAMRNFRTLAKERPSFDTPDAIGPNTFDAVLEACAANDELDAAIEFWTALQDQCQRISEKRPPSPDNPKPRPYLVPLTSSYNYMMSVYASRGNTDQVRLLFDEKRDLYPPDAEMYKQMIRAHVVKQSWMEATEIYDEMVKQHIMPDVETVDWAMKARGHVY
ncbi:hypothetical protein HDV00_007807 [Rhizophlyctis rosea]|nr:hypothetical protein HDV00_007807 [Rhizophlyctis rosea]